MSEFSRVYDLRHLPAGAVELEADEAEREALAQRFLLVRVDELRGRFTLTPAGQTVRAEGRFAARFVQSCAVSGEDLPMAVDEPVALRFVPPLADLAPDTEIELEAGELDEIELDPAGRFDLGEALAQSLALAIDPFATGPGADEARRRAGLLDPEQTGPFAALAALKKD